MQHDQPAYFEFNVTIEHDGWEMPPWSANEFDQFWLRSCGIDPA